MHRRLTRIASGGAVVLALASVVQPGNAQVEIRSRALEITLTGRLHTQFNTTSVAGEPGSEFLTRRARLTAEVKINDFVTGKIQPDYGEGEITLKDAYIGLDFSPAFQVRIGQFKRPFDLFELTSSTQILVVERAGGIRGVNACTGPGGVCALSRFTEKLQYSDRDIGVMVEGSDPSDRFGYAASVTNGTGQNRVDENGAKSFTGRLTFSPLDDVAIGANLALHDYVDPATRNEYATAFGGDVEIGNYSQGLHVQAGVVAGDNWANLLAGGPSTFLTAQGIVTYKVPVSGSPFVSAIEPVGRVSWGDPDTDLSDDEGLLFTPGLVVYFAGRNKVGANLDIWSPAAGDLEWSLKVQSYLHF